MNRGISKTSVPWLILSVSPSVIAAPNFDGVVHVSGQKLFPDHEKNNFYYYEPKPYRLAQSQGMPVFSYSIFRYIGRRETSDYGNFSVKGILTFELEQKTDLDLHNSLSARFGDNVILRPLPLDGFESKINYRVIEKQNIEKNTAEERGKITEGVLSGGVETTPDLEHTVLHKDRWQRRRFTIGLKKLTAELFSYGFENDKLLLSFDYQWQSKGVIKGETQADSPWREHVREGGEAISINVSMKQYPELFRRPNTMLEMDRAHTDLTVSCYDFINELATNVYKVMVEVGFQTLRRQHYIERVSFREGEDNPNRKISFKLAKDLNNGYQYRVTRIFMDGSSDKTPWLTSHGAYLDVSIDDDDENHEEEEA